MPKRSLFALVCAFSSLLSVAAAQAPDAQGGQGDLQQPGMWSNSAPQQAPQQAPLVEPPPPMRLAPNALYAELGGNGGFYTLNYERRIIEPLAIRVGFGFISLSASAGGASASSSVISVPVMANYLGIGNDNHHLELGAGLLLVWASGSASSSGVSASGSGVGLAGTMTAGYRYQRRDGGFLFRAGFTPWFGKVGFQAWGGISLGGAF